jgi:putative chitinase
MDDAAAMRLQATLGVAIDGNIGRGTLTALFRKFGAGPERAAELALSANVHLRTYGILDTPLRLAHFMAQLIHESGSFRYMEEIASGSAYEGRADLGNIVNGDGKRYKGRGPIQLTGRANYKTYGRLAGVDFERHPELVATPSIGLLVACMFWDREKLNALADQDDIRNITRRINGGLNGFEDRQANLRRVKALL